MALTLQRESTGLPCFSPLGWKLKNQHNYSTWGYITSKHLAPEFRRYLIPIKSTIIFDCHLIAMLFLTSSKVSRRRGPFTASPLKEYFLT
jgi:hypothetical protein